ncbi:TPA: hypothetical protein J1413_001358 [Escherichia coli]|nr:hypothetical protein [Escherichia coli]HBA9519627.1 hypothetical protein [Escherichia coli]HBA9548866.1 hypothetical protein [Escherichia coli]HBA9557005.1 hypothetical protein [Escherichia coli]
MLFLCKPFQEMKVITFQTIRDKYIEVVRLQREERERLQNIVGLIAENFENSLELEHPRWGYPGQNLTEDYVFIAAIKEGEKSRVQLHDLLPDADGVLSFFIGLTVDKSPVAHPKLNVIIPLKLVRDGNGFTLVAGNGEFETSLSEKPASSELETVSEALKQAVIRDLETYIPVR